MARLPRDAAPPQPVCADVDGFLNAVRCETSDRKLLEQLCRNITRPALKLKTPGETAPCTN